MSARTTWVWLALCAALAVFWFAHTSRVDDAADARPRIFGALQSEDIERLRVRTSDGVLATLAREGAGWRIQQPIEFPADALVADAITGALVGLRAEAVYETPEALQHYGLDGPPLVEFETTGGARFALRVGEHAALGDGRYMSDAAARRVFLVPAWRAAALTRRFDELRDARVLAFEIPAVRGLRARWPGGAVSVARVPGGWRLVAPVAAPADEGRIEALLERLSYLRAEDFEDAPAAGEAQEREEHGLARPVFALELDIEGSETPLHFALGAEREVKRADDADAHAEHEAHANEDALHADDAAATPKKQRVARGQGGQLYWVAASLLDALPRTTFAYRAHRLARFAPETIEAIELRYPVSGYANDPGGRPLRLRLERAQNDASAGAGENWRVFFYPFGSRNRGFIPNFDFYAELAEAVLSEFSALDASDVLDEGGRQRTRYGLRPPRVSVRLFTSSARFAKPATTLFFGRPIPERGIPVQGGGGGPIFLVPLELAESIPLDAQHFRSELNWSTSEPLPKTSGGG